MASTQNEMLVRLKLLKNAKLKGEIELFLRSSRIHPRNKPAFTSLHETKMIFPKICTRAIVNGRLIRQYPTTEHLILAANFQVQSLRLATGQAFFPSQKPFLQSGEYCFLPKAE
jgi:hypothetical protein